MPSSKKARRAMLQLVESAGDGPIVDLGSGWGSLVVRLALQYPNRQVVGYELSLLPWLVTVLISKCMRLKNVTVYREDFLKADLSSASVIVCYLFPAGMAALATKLAEQKIAPRYLISNTFALPSYQPETTLRLDDLYRSPIYCYRISPADGQ
ncbi:class I SAM-dependent methyltransferase [Simiduia curdlanivorans]|uniref:Class I SAM-dependent methyltransferase n=1 Tax=Simiduia curdlanivorans TaxID=1492769 RepID=A0ABV8V9R0_9GAMM|nr:class I SAM-dependent methyltransferase [Simiduia curdlanivorans]MDN3638785.1 class I SAM-dependent methyltransferase [Simiduia curdlanivorans]